MLAHLRFLHIACAAKARPRSVTLTRAKRDEILYFSILGKFTSCQAVSTLAACLFYVSISVNAYRLFSWLNVSTYYFGRGSRSKLWNLYFKRRKRFKSLPCWAEAWRSDPWSKWVKLWEYFTQQSSGGTSRHHLAFHYCQIQSIRYVFFYLIMFYPVMELFSSGLILKQSCFILFFTQKTLILFV